MNWIKFKQIYHEAPYFQPLMATLSIYLIFVYLLTLNPFRFGLFHFYRFIQFRGGLLSALLGGSYISDMILNLVMLLPFGLVIGLLLRMLQLRVRKSIMLAAAAGFLISLSIEICQLFLPRSFSGVDIFTNTLGAGLGAGLAYPVNGFDSQEIFRKLYDRGRLFYTRVILIYCLAATFILMIPVSFNTFSNWNRGFRLFIGNEATLNRPWSGVIYKLSIFNRIFNDEAVKNFYAINPRQKTTAELSSGLLVEYLFTNPAIQSFGVLKDALELNPPPNSSFAFDQNGGIVLKENSLIGTSAPATDLVQLLKKTNQLSVAVWFQPGSLHQDGPARIVTLSKNTDHRNFTLGQSGQNLNFRVRTPFTGSNASTVDLTTPPIITLDQPQFVVATFHRGEMKLYHNGKLVSSVIYDTSHYLPLLGKLSQDRFGKAAFCFMLLFPLGWLSRGLVRFKVWKSIVSGLIVMAPFLILSSITIFILHHKLDFHLLYLCCSVSLLVMVVGLVYELLLTQ